ncbi:histidine phosphatase family protein [Curvibacter sp. HBC28]|uniref:Histidine phosphatase family protein n=1 Tax=Curvibacter microcysteis TaxID=3026419 RepID=A0ABT5MJS3_9BURK|nr:histidine phosphatase family protein [Curvibacter sp. HBC28]MDD0816778.1 histidine phosphatase family protein [Curvibacter sp. HBC28]
MNIKAIWSAALAFCRWLVLLGLGTAAQATELSEALAGPQHVLLMRHAYAPGYGDPSGYVLGRCETQRLLNDEGKAQAVETGSWLQQQGVKQAEVHTSPWCRCQQTAERLGLGEPRTQSALGSFFDQPEQATSQNLALQRLIADRLLSKGSQALVLVTHDVNIHAFSGLTVHSGDMVLARVNAQGQGLEFKVLKQP